MLTNRLFSSCLVVYLLVCQFCCAQNAADADTTFISGHFNHHVLATLIQPDDKIIVGGFFSKHQHDLKKGLARLNSDGTLDRSFPVGTGPDGSVYCLLRQPDGKILVGGYFLNYNGTPCGGLVRINADGTLDNTFSSETYASNTVKALSLQSDGKIIVGGEFTYFNGQTRNRLVRINSDGTLDNTFSIGTGANNNVNAVAVQSDGKIIVGGSFTSFNSVDQANLIRLNSDGSIDNSFAIGTGPNGAIHTIFIQSNGKILAGGLFNSFNGSTSYRNIVRLETSGSNDFAFSCRPDETVYAIAVQSDSKIVIGGNFKYIDSYARDRIARLEEGGSLDYDFIVGTGCDRAVRSLTVLSSGDVLAGGEFEFYNSQPFNRIVLLSSNGSKDSSFRFPMGADNEIAVIKTQPDEKILAAGSFVMFNGEIKNRIIRLNVDGTTDPTFNTGTGASNNYIYDMAVQPDGKIILAGSFTSFNGNEKPYLVRLNSNGSIDNSFTIGTGPSAALNSVVLQNDGKIVIGGGFGYYNGVARGGVARLNSNGTLDMSFDPGSGANPLSVSDVKVQSDGKVIAVGFFTNFNGVSKRYIVRLLPNGAIDNTFQVGIGFSGGTPSCIALQDDGKILLGGMFTNYNGTPLKYLTRLNSTGKIDKTFVPGTPFNSGINEIKIQYDGKIFVAGGFSTYNSVDMPYLVCLKNNGTLDVSYNNGVGSGQGSGQVTCIHFQEDRKILIGGALDYYKSTIHNKIARLRGTPTYLNHVNGVVYTDANQNCNFESTETRIEAIVVKAMPGPYFASTDEFGEYRLDIDSGSNNYTLFLQKNSVQSTIVEDQCSNTHSVVLKGHSKDTASFDFADTVRACSLLEVFVTRSRTRRCFRGSAFVSYHNSGSGTSPNAYVTVTYPDFIIPLSSSPAWTSKVGNVLTYNVGSLPKNKGGQITIIDSVMCGNEFIRGLTQCTKAEIFPPSDCYEADPLWDQSIIEVTGRCQSEMVEFEIHNTGHDMNGQREFRVFENDTIIHAAYFQLPASGYVQLKYPANGKTLRVEAEQHTLHPGRNNPGYVVEACTSSTHQTVTPGFFVTHPLYDTEDYLDIFCGTITDSFDPNDKSVIPEGSKNDHKIAQGTELEYRIRFQNTGTDTAYNVVVVVDTLDAAIDPATFKTGTSSHPYTWKMSGKGRAVLTFTFSEINLPDSTRNKILSNGIITFNVRIPETIPLGSTIRNKAYIYFDYNSPIITNEVTHSIDNNVPTDLSKGNAILITTDLKAKQVKQTMRVYPNPAHEHVYVELPDGLLTPTLKIYSIEGTLHSSAKIKKGEPVNVDMLRSGSYLYEVLDGESRVYSGLLLID